ncbi:MAG: AmmeMemoRadiSam system protein B [Candidatus Aenigmarchaeota archaeon]|nr:AmmeMemoRadiSam system protein B [Candidatus Aenigmarchaeota archaeon]
MFKIREAFASGVLYENEASLLKSQLERCFSHQLGPRGIKPQAVRSCIVPHNSLESSGPVAAWMYSKLEKSNFIILGAAHKPLQSQFSMMKEGLWKTPLGELLIDANIAKKLSDSCDLIKYDSSSHQTEHSIEMQLPFLQYRFGNDIKFVPILIFNNFADENFLNNCRIVGEAIADVIKSSKDKWTVIASSDLSQNKKFDNTIIKPLLKFNGEKLFSKIKNNETKICGFGCIATAIAAAKKLGAGNAKLLKYATASQIISNSSSTGYASIIFY